MRKLLIQIKDLKAYARILKKHNGGIKHGHILDQLTRVMGFDHYDAYERYLNGSVRDSDLKAHSVESMSLPDMEAWAWRFSFDLEHGLELRLPRPIKLLGREFPSTPLDRYIRIQEEHIDELPALRISGLLYLITLATGRDFMNTDTLSVDWLQVLDSAKNDTLPAVIRRRLTHYDQMNCEQGTRYHEGVYLDAAIALKRGYLSEDGFIHRLYSLLEEEIDYLRGFDVPWLDHTNARFGFPFYSPAKIGNGNLSEWSQIRSMTDRHKPLLLGVSRPEGAIAKLMGAHRTLTLRTETIRENFLITGSAGSGRTHCNMAILRQAIMNDSGALYISGKGDNEVLWFTKSLMRPHKKEDRMKLITTNHSPSVAKLDLIQCVRQRSVTHIMMPCLEKAPDVTSSHFWGVINSLMASARSQKEPMKGGYFPYCVFLDDISCAIRNQNDVDALCDFIDQMNYHNIAVILSQQPSPLLDDDSTPVVMGKNRNPIMKRFGSRILMKQEFDGNKWSIGRDLVSMDPGEFRFQRIGSDPEPYTYRIPYADISLIDHLYLVMS